MSDYRLDQELSQQKQVMSTDAESKPLTLVSFVRQLKKDGLPHSINGVPFPNWVPKVLESLLDPATKTMSPKDQVNRNDQKDQNDSNDKKESKQEDELCSICLLMIERHRNLRRVKTDFDLNCLGIVMGFERCLPRDLYSRVLFQYLRDSKLIEPVSIEACSNHVNTHRFSCRLSTEPSDKCIGKCALCASAGRASSGDMLMAVAWPTAEQLSLLPADKQDQAFAAIAKASPELVGKSMTKLEVLVHFKCHMSWPTID